VKVLNPTVTIMLASHMKPNWLPESLESILAQTRRDIQVIVADSGAWIGREPEIVAADHPAAMGQIYHQYVTHPLIEWVTLDQRWPTPLPERACPYTYVWNRVIEAGLVRGKYLAVFTDDDVYAPTFVERMAGFLDSHFDGAVYCGQGRSQWEAASEGYPGGRWVPGMLHQGHAADRPRGPGEFLDQVDMTQVMFRTEVLGVMPSPPFDEDPADQACRHADGVFLERLVNLTGILPARITGVVPNIPDVLVTHRYTPDSTYN
jgi:hypothetical protein